MYQEVRNAEGLLIAILRLEDGASIPLTEANSDYRAYLAWVELGNVPEADPRYSLDVIRAKKWLEIKAQRDARKSGGVKVVIDGQTLWLHSDADSRIQWLGLKDRARDVLAAGGDMNSPVQIMGSNILWKTLTGSFVQVTVALTFAVVDQTGILDAILFSQAESKRVTVNNHPSPEQFDADVDWFPTYEESI